MSIRETKRKILFRQTKLYFIDSIKSLFYGKNFFSYVKLLKIIYLSQNVGSDIRSKSCKSSGGFKGVRVRDEGGGLGP